MADVHDKKTRSYNMSRIKGKNTKPEEIVRSFLFSNGFRYRKNDRRYPGTPDIVLPKYKVMIFVNGCFWHKHEGCRYFVWPQNNAAFWKDKIETNALRDQRNYDAIQKMGWRVIVIWECELKSRVRDQTLDRLKGELLSVTN